MSELVFGYVTFSSEREATKIGRAIIEENIAACVNLIGKIKSMYKWKDEIESDEEYAMIVKTTKSNKEDVKNNILNLHSYDTPCIVFFESESYSEGFYNWIKKMVESRK